MCDDCRHLRSALDDLKDQLEAERMTISRQARVELDLRRKLNAKDADENQDPLVKELLAYAKQAWRKNSKWDTGAASDRYALVDKTLRAKIRLAKKQGHPRDKAVQVAFDWCKTVMLGMSLIPYVGPRGRAGLPYAGARKMIDVVYCFGDDERWERCWLEATGRPWSDDPEVEAEEREWAAATPAEDSREWRAGMQDAKKQAAAVAHIQPLLFQPKTDPVDAVIDALERLGKDWRCVGGSNWLAQCPAHEDRTPSFGFRDVGDKVVFTCRTGCSQDRILEALGLDWPAFFRDDQRRAA